MKRTTLILGLVLILGLSQITYGQNRIGLIGGLNSASMALKIDGETPDVTGKKFVGFGAVADFKLRDGIYLSLEPMYIKKGAEAVRTDEPDAVFTIKLSYLEIPVLLKKEFGNNVRPYIAAGPVIGYNLSADMEIEFSGIVLKGDMKHIIKTFDLGFAFGGGVSFPLGGSSVFIEGKYTLGLNNIEKQGSFEVSSGPLSQTIVTDPTDKTKNKRLQLMAGFSFPFGGK